jgi:pimeloyl-ACP methyl ester carboxylesterase
VRPPLLVLACCLAVAVPATTASAASPTSITHAKVRTVKAGPGKIGYRSVGKGRPIVLIMGLSGSMDAWDPNVVDALAKKHRVITFDNEGIGKSTLGPGALSITRMGDNTAALIKKLKLGRPDVIGWSMGGMIAQSLTIRHPKQVRRLVLGATAPGDGQATFPALEVIQFLTSGGANAATLFELLFPPGQEAVTAGFAARILTYPNAAPQAPPAVTSAQLSATTTWLTGADPTGRKLATIKQRVLVAGGGLDRLLPAANQRHIGAVIPNATTHIFENAAHGFFVQEQATFVPELLKFLR